MKTFEEYYEEYLGINRSKLKKGSLNLFSSPYRELPICQFYYAKVIICNWEDYDICSCPEFLKKELEGLNLNEVKQRVSELLPEITWCSYKRYSYDSADTEIETRAIPLSYNFYIKNMKKPFEELTDYYKKIIHNDMLQIVYNEDRICSQAYVSDIYAGGGNISVNSFEAFRNRGYASECVKATLNYAMKREIRPIYLVREDNLPSIRVAEKNGFIFKVNELSAHYKSEI